MRKEPETGRKNMWQQQKGKARTRWIAKVEDKKSVENDIQYWNEQISNAESNIKVLEQKGLLLDKEVKVSLAACNNACNNLKKNQEVEAMEKERGGATKKAVDAQMAAIVAHWSSQNLDGLKEMIKQRKAGDFNYIIDSRQPPAHKSRELWKMR